MKIVPIMGPPCAGKTTTARELLEPGDVIVDLDALAHALGYPAEHIDHDEPPHAAVTLAWRARASILKALTQERRHPAATALVIATDGIIGLHSMRVDPGPDVCHQRADTDGRPASTHAQIDAWYTRHGRTT